jgi:HEAT repeat protein
MLISGEEYEGLQDLVRLGRRAVPVLVRILQRDPRPMIRKRAAVALGRIGVRTVAPPLVKALSDRSPVVVISVLDALGAIAAPRAVKDVARHLESKDASVRRAAAEALAALGSPDAAAPLRGMLAREKEPFVREAGGRALARLEAR